MRAAFFFFLLFVPSLLARAQFNEIRKFPYILHNNKSNAKILDLGDNHLIFITGSHSLFVSHSYDNGSTWGTPITVWDVNPDNIGNIGPLDAIVLPTGRIVIVFNIPDSVVTIVSDDYGITWSQNGFIIGAKGVIKLYYSDKLYAFYSSSRNLYYSASVDGTNWIFYGHIYHIAPFNIGSFSFIEFSFENYIVALANSYSIILKKSNNLLENWTVLDTVFHSQNLISDIDGIKDTSGKYWLSYSVNEPLYDQSNYNIYFITSEDGGLTWDNAEIFGKSYKDDLKVRLSLSSANPFAVFISNRNDGQNIPYYYGKLGISEDTYYPPFLQDYSTHIVDNYPNTITVNATARAFTDRTSFSVSLTYNGNFIGTMYDDGEHNDGAAGDSIFGASYTFNYSDLGDEPHSVGFSATDVNLSSVSLQVLTLNLPIPNGWNYYVLRNGNTKFAVESNGVISLINGRAPLNTYDNIPVTYDAGFMMSGITDGEIWSNAMAISLRLEDYVSGTIDDTSTAVYVVKSSDQPFGESWQNWRAAVEKGAYFYDGDSDGVYNPVDLNGNGKWGKNEDCPDILGDVTVWSVYNDGVPSADRRYMDVSPQGIEIRQTTWTKYDKDFNKNVYYIRYSIVNRGTVTDTLKDVYFGLWMDNDAGYFWDDLLGCSIPTRSGYTYNSGGDEYFGESAPAVMATLLQGPYRYTGNPDDEATNNMGKLLGVRRINGAVNDTMTSHIDIWYSTPIPDDPPNNKEEARYYLLGLDKRGEVIDPCNWQFGEVFGEDCSLIDGHFRYSGNPYDSTGWINIYPTDQLQMLNTGPFNLIKDKAVDIICAYHFSKGESSLQSVQLGLEKAQELHNHFFPDSSDENENDLPAKFNLEQNYPNPFNNTTTISYVIANPNGIGVKQSTGNSAFANNSTVRLGRSHAPLRSARNDATIQVSLKVYDILGREVARLVNKKQAPGKYSVQFNGRNLASGVYFYTLKVGDFVQTQKMVLMK